MNLICSWYLARNFGFKFQLVVKFQWKKRKPRTFNRKWIFNKITKSFTILLSCSVKKAKDTFTNIFFNILTFNVHIYIHARQYTYMFLRVKMGRLRELLCKKYIRIENWGRNSFVGLTSLPYGGIFLPSLVR